VDDAVQDGVAESGLANDLMPSGKGELAGDQQGAAAMTILDDLHQVAALAGGEAVWPCATSRVRPLSERCGKGYRAASSYSGLFAFATLAVPHPSRSS
jgi:hypothetical protein